MIPGQVHVIFNLPHKYASSDPCIYAQYHWENDYCNIISFSHTLNYQADVSDELMATIKWPYINAPPYLAFLTFNRGNQRQID